MEYETRKHKIEENSARTRSLLMMKNNDAISSIKKEKLNSLNTLQYNFNAAKTQSETCKSSVCAAYVHDENTDAETTKEKSTVTLAHYFFGNAQIVSPCTPTKNEIISDMEQFKTDETPVAVPIHGPSTPHRINMPLEDLIKRSMITTIEKPSMITLVHNPLQVPVIKKPAPRGRKKAVSNKSGNIVAKSSANKTNHSITDYFPVRRSVRKSKKVVLEEKQRDLENKVLCQVEEGLEIGYFTGKGRGVITTREFAKGEFVVEYIGELISQAEAKEREKIYAQDQNAGCYMYYFQYRNHQYCIDATAETNRLGRLVNHSRNGNLVTRIVEVGSTPHLVLTAKEDIPINVEVSYDYGDRSRESIRHHPWLAL